MRTALRAVPLLFLLAACQSEPSTGPTPATAEKSTPADSKKPATEATSTRDTPVPQPGADSPARKLPVATETKSTETAGAVASKTGNELPPSRFNLSTLRAPELQDHKAPPPPMRQEATGSGPQTNRDLKDIAKDVDSKAEQADGKGPPVERLSDGRIRVGRVTVDRKKNRVEVESTVNMTEGILEYYAVGPTGKTHESVLTYSGLASQVHLGLLLLGLEPKKRGGPMVELKVEWKEKKGGKLRSVPAEFWLRDRSTSKQAKRVTWRFQGSGFFRGKYAGDTAQTLVGLIPDPNVVIVLDAQAGNPYRGENLGFDVLTEKIPDLGTDVTLVIMPVK